MCMKHLGLSYLSVFIFLFISIDGQTQLFDPEAGCTVDVNGQCLPNTVLTAVPFLRVVPDARSAGLGDAGIATSIDPAAMHFNASKLAFAENKFGFSGNHTGLLNQEDLSDAFLSYLAGYFKIDDNQAIGLSFKYFNVGSINFTDFNGNPIINGNPKEYEFALAYSKKLGDKLSAGLSAKYISSNLATGQQNVGIDIITGKAFAADFSLSYLTKLGKKQNELSVAGAISNVGTKISYANHGIDDFLPGNLGFGTSYKMNLSDMHSLTLTVDANKLLVPTPQPFTIIEIVDGVEREIQNPDYDLDSNSIPDFRERSIFSGIFGSFTDAPRGLSEELEEINYSFGAEYILNEQYAARAGYFYEHENKGDRQYLTVGFGAKYKAATINVSYQIPTSRSNRLGNALRLSLIFDFLSVDS